MQCLPATAQRAVDRHWALQTRQTKQALNKAQCMAQRHTQQAFDAQAELDCGVRENSMALLSLLARAYQRMSLSNQFVSDPRAFSAALYAAKLVAL